MVFGLVRFIFIEETVIVQLLSETAPCHHNQNSHLEGKW